MIPGSNRPAFSLSGQGGDRTPVLIAAPHCGRDYPKTLLAQMRDAEQSRIRLEDRYIDMVAAPAAEAAGSGLLLAHAPRALIDLNRSVEDIDWGMVRGEKPQNARHSLANRRARNGLGLVPRRIPGMGEIWRSPIKRPDLDARIDGVYNPYHATLGHELDTIRDAWGAALLIDLHSMPPLRPSVPNDRPAEFVIGDRFGASCDDRLVDITLRYFASEGRRAVHNRPYSGGYILDRFGQTRRSVHAMQIEVCRTTYLDNRLDQPTARVGAIAKLIAGLARVLAAEVSRMGEIGGFAQAAE